RATLQEEASKLDEQYADVMEQMRSAGRDPYEAKYVMPGLRERAQSIREQRTANRNRQAELDGQEATQGAGEIVGYKNPEIEAERATLQEEASKLDEQYADVMEQMRSVGRDPVEAQYAMPGLRERAQSIRERRTANRNRQAELDGQEAEQNFAIQQIRESGKSRERRVRFDYEEDVADNLNRAFNNFDGKTREAQLRTEYYEMLQAANPDKDSPAAQFMVNQAKRAEAWERYQESSSMTSLNWSQMQEAWSNWQKTKNGNTTQEEKVAAYESFSKAQNEYYDSYSSVIQAMRSYNDASKVEREVTSSGTFNAFETMENHNDWQKENAIRQTEFLKAIAENTENGLF
ncbi:MAG: hypothetical protein IJE77_10470, partial [Thermoguttaceae bacterium]|nr:hypothetical protein [Thermoguttaceae bacterium]